MRPASVIAVSLVWLVGIVPAAAGGMDADFIGDGTYATVENCEKLNTMRTSRLSDPGPTPETLQKGGLRSGLYGSEVGCLFTRVAEVEQSQRWSVDFYCVVSHEESQKSGTFQRKVDGSLDFQETGNLQVTHFVPCDFNGYIID
jgi:hypothetical protein